ncbi:hypothetical protein ACFSUH_44250 [Rhodococcus jostii]|uniref:Uncharacterized protein n=1 Tax=Rhodococcus jostii TaxID=132919 RepID=A0A1H4JHY0_RHOJO|nr:hypothetical protein [Rhodococcus jostii]SEB45228.1 hypothetical protein SAMN04490220_0878 [Rhodococcus jostii]
MGSRHARFHDHRSFHAKPKAAILPDRADPSFHQRDRHPGCADQVVSSAAMGEGHGHSPGVSLGEPCEQLAVASNLVWLMSYVMPLRMRLATIPSFC